MKTEGALTAFTQPYKLPTKTCIGYLKAFFIYFKIVYK